MRREDGGAPPDALAVVPEGEDHGEGGAGLVVFFETLFGVLFDSWRALALCVVAAAGGGSS